MANRLADQNSPYLLQHSENPVDWYPWGDEALEKARREDKPIFLSIGYAACHWCHVMAHESFEDLETARLMNSDFINIKVDREERPDLDSIYMNAVVAMTGQGGWPMSVFVTPDGQPFYGGTYFPPFRRYNMPSFKEVLITIARAWKEDRPQLLRAGKEITQHLESAPNLSVGAAHPITQKVLEEAALRLAQAYDWEFGGWGQAPKFPQPLAIDFLLRLATRGDSMALQIARHALDSMSLGGMYDVVGGGFARYSTDNEWLVPHFEKMLYDNALLARAYLYAYLVSEEPYYRRVCEETLGFIERELMASPVEGQRPHSGFYSSLDADSEGEEGKYYLWTPTEIRAALVEPMDAELFLAAYGVTEAGNFEGKTVLQRAEDDADLAQRFHQDETTITSRLIEMHSLLLEARRKRIPPATDDKVLVSWNGLALIVFAEASRYLKRPDYLEIARQNADFLLTELHPQDRLLRSWRAGRAQHNAYLEDYAALILGLLSLYQSDPDPWWFQSAAQLIDEMLAYYADPQGGFFDTRSDQTGLLLRPKDLQDNAVPSGNSLAAMALLQMSAFTGNGEWHDRADTMLMGIQSAAIRYPTAFAQWLCALDFSVGPVLEIALIGPPELPEMQALLSTVWEQFRPRSVEAASAFPPPPNAPPLLQDRPLLNGRPTAYVCQGFVCQQPVNTPEDLSTQLVSSYPKPLFKG